jgi:Protein of unknown function (DUF2637)
MTTQVEVTRRNHRRAVRFFWSFLIGATLVSLIGNVVHAVWHLIPFVLIQIGTAAVPPLFLLAVVHGIALSVRAGASGTVYRCAITATAVIGVGAFVLSFRALRDLLMQMGTTPAWAWLFPAVVDTAIGVSTMMLVALGDKPARRAPRLGAQTAPVQKAAQIPSQSAKPGSTQLHRVMRGPRGNRQCGCQPLHWHNPTRHTQCRLQRKLRRSRLMPKLQRSTQTLHQS